MNSRQRYENIIKGKEVDFLPRIPILMQFAAEYIGSNYGEFASDYSVLVEANHRCITDFDFDQLSAISDSYRETSAFGGEISYQSDGAPRCTAPLAETKDLSFLQKPDPVTSERLVDRIQAVETYKKRFGNEYSILGWVEGPAAEAGDLRGINNFLMDSVDDEEFVDELMDLSLETAIGFAQAQVRAGADTIGIGDAVASLFSPAMYERHILPREEKLCESIRQTGAYVKLHICGNITHLLPGIARLPIDIIDVDHMVDLEKVRKTLPDHIVITGNIDPVKGVMQGTPAAIRDQIIDDYHKVGNPFMVNAGCEIPSQTPPENLHALCKPIPYES
ncbi:MAG: uroporphyrinogen decarboxylase family protein [Spirochaetales bacterium]|nr:uroporphyrinogen decarboxylase family protein [Spirochaetales bacterium]MCF7937898.1 uroporphyrinogen decarboxylase family protein [Spirochaetales bacterium]